MIYFRCRNCGALIKVSDRFAGKKGKCAKCGTTNDIPMESQRPPASPKAEATRSKSAAPPTAPADAAPTAPHPQAAPPGARAEAPPEAHAVQAEVAPEEPPARPPRPRSELPAPAAQIDQLVSRLRQRGGSGLFGTVERVAYTIGVYGVLAMAPFLVLVGLSILPGKTDEGWTKADKVQMCLTLVVGGLLLLLCQYVIAKVRAASVKIVRSSPAALGTTHLLDCLAVLLVVGAVIALGGGAHWGYQTGSWHEGIVTGAYGLAAALLCLLLAAAALHPAELSIVITPKATAGQEALGFFSFLCKVVLRVAPVLLLVQLAASIHLLAWAAYQSVETESVAALGASGTTVCLGLIGFTAAYVLVYLLFLAYHLLVDLILSLFQIAANTRPRERARRIEQVEESAGGR